MNTPSPAPSAGGIAIPPPDPALAAAWQQYCNWAAQARMNQRSTRRGNLISLILIVAAAVFGAIAAVLAMKAGDRPAVVSLQIYLSWLAAAATAAASVLGKELIVNRNEEIWITTRSIAEAIKSECFRYAAASGDYAPAHLAGSTAAGVLRNRVQRLTQGQINQPPQVPARTSPTMPMTSGAYVDERMKNQRDFYVDGYTKHSRATRRVLRWGLAGALITALLSVAAGSYAVLTPIVATLTTAIGAIVAFGLLERHKAIASSYGKMRDSLGWMIASAPHMPLADLVTETEDLLQSEHGAWVMHMRLAANQPMAAPPGGAGAPAAAVAPVAVTPPVLATAPIVAASTADAIIIGAVGSATAAQPGVSAIGTTGAPHP